MFNDWNRRQFMAAAAILGARAAYGAPGGGRIRIGQIGTGHAHAEGKMATLRAMPELYEVVGVVETDPKRRAAAQKNKTYQDLAWMTQEQLLNTPGLAAAAVETTVRDLVPTAQRCAEAGLFLHVDKPGGESLSAFRKLLETAAAKKRVIQMGYMLRYNAGMRLIHRAAAEGWLGEVFALHGEMSKRVDSGRAALAEYQGGMMFELGCHLLDSVVKILGKPRKVTPFIRRSHLKEDDLADNMLAVLEYPQATATIRSSLIDFAGGPRRQMVVSGTEGTIELKPLEPAEVTLNISAAHGGYKKGSQTLKPGGKTGRYDGDFLDLAQVIRGEKPFDWSMEHDLAAQETILLASGLPID